MNIKSTGFNRNKYKTKEKLAEPNCNFDTSITDTIYTEGSIQSMREFNRWTYSINFDISRFIRNSPNIPIDDFSINPENPSCDVDFYFILHAMKYVEDMQEIGNMKCNESFIMNAKTHSTQFNLSIYRNVQDKHWFIAVAIVEEYMKAVKRILVSKKLKLEHDKLKR
jgi:hypothetical protein